MCILANCKLSAYHFILYKEIFKNSLNQVKGLCKNEEISPILFDLLKEQWNFMVQHNKDFRIKRLDIAVNDPILMFGIYNDPKIRMSEFLRFPSNAKDSARSLIRIFLSIRQFLYILTDIENSDDLENFPLKEEELEFPDSDIFHLTSESRVINCQQFIDNLLQERYSFYLKCEIL